MPKVNIYLPDELAAAVREADVPVSAVCQAALERAVRDVAAARGAEAGPSEEGPAIGLFSRFTPRARTAVVYAQQIASDEAGSEHVLVGILEEGGNLAIRVLDQLEVDQDALRAGVDVGTGGVEQAGHVPFSANAKRALEAATKEAIALGHNYIGCEHLLLGLLATEDSRASKALRRSGLEIRTTRRAVVAALYTTMTQQAQAPAAPSATTLERILSRLDAIERRLPPEA